MEALECAREGQLWGPALVLASQLGDQVLAVTRNISLAISHAWIVLWLILILF